LEQIIHDSSRPPRPSHHRRGPQRVRPRPQRPRLPVRAVQGLGNRRQATTRWGQGDCLRQPAPPTTGRRKSSSHCARPPPERIRTRSRSEAGLTQTHRAD
jgi:hypothetical protein